MSVQNLAWGFLSVLYLAGMLLFVLAEGMLGVMLGAGVLIGLAFACTAAIALAVGSRAVPSHCRSLVLGASTASGSLGALLSAPLGQWLAVGLAGVPACWASWCWRSACCRPPG